MNKHVFRYLMVSICLFSVSGCVSGLIAASGKSYSHLEDPKVKVAQIRKELGDPIFSRSYSPPTRISETEIYRDRAAEYPDFPPVVITENRSPRLSYREMRNQYTALCEVYNPHGWYAERETQAYGMVGAMTLGIGDVAMIPGVLSRKGQSVQEGVFVTFWYDAKGNYVATYSGDISAARKKPSHPE
jgi:hypothetical protein